MSPKEKVSVKSKKVRFRIETELLKEVETYIDAYNRDPERVTRKIRISDVVNQAFATYLGRRGSGLPRGVDKAAPHGARQKLEVSLAPGVRTMMSARLEKLQPEGRSRSKTADQLLSLAVGDFLHSVRGRTAAQKPPSIPAPAK
ncbi:hypothetical protein [Salinispira pacifica]